MNKTSSTTSTLPWIAAMAFFMQALDATILNTALPAIAHSLDRSPLAMQSAIISYTLTVAMLIPISGWLADRFGTRTVFIFAVSLFSLGSLFCALSHSLLMLVLSRILQGIGGAMMMPVARLALLRAYPRNELLPVLNLVTIPGLVGPVVGPMLGGLFVTYATWHWIFIINIPIGLLGIYFARRHMPNFTQSKIPFDSSGFIIFGFSLVAFTGGMELFGEKMIPGYLSLLILFSGALLMLVYVWHAKKHSNPLIKLSLFDNRTFSIGILGNIFSRLGTGCVPFLIPLMLQVGFGYPAIIAGCMMAPSAIGALLAKSFIARVLSLFGYRRVLIVVTLVIGIMIMLFSLQTPERSLWLFILPLLFLGIFMSTQFTSMNTLTLGNLDDDQASSGNSILAVTQQLSVSFGVAISAAVLRFYEGKEYGNMIDNFHYTFLTMGFITLLSSVIFMQLKSKDGNDLIKRKTN